MTMMARTLCRERAADDFLYLMQISSRDERDEDAAGEGVHLDAGHGLLGAERRGNGLGVRHVAQRTRPPPRPAGSTRRKDERLY